VTVNSPTSATATLTIDAAATLAARNVIVQTTLPDSTVEMLTVNAGFTVQQVSTTPPSLVSLSPAANAQDVPLNAKITMVFSEPLSRTSVTSSDIYLVAENYGCYYAYYGYTPVTPGTLTVDASGRIVTLVPSSPLVVPSRARTSSSQPASSQTAQVRRLSRPTSRMAMQQCRPTPRLCLASMNRLIRPLR
jgi:hypothetical protein